MRRSLRQKHRRVEVCAQNNRVLTRPKRAAVAPSVILQGQLVVANSNFLI